MSEQRPERIWLLHNAGDQGEDLWCDQPAPNEPAPESTEYVRADRAGAAPALVEALELALQHLIAQQVSARKAARYDEKWEGVAEAMQPAVDQARAALAEEE